MDVSEVAPNKSIFVHKSRLAPEISHNSEVAPNKGNSVLESRSTLEISRLENFIRMKY